MKTFLPFKIGQSLRRVDAHAVPEGFSFNIPQGDLLAKKGAVFAFVNSQEEGADCRVIARRLVNDYSATSHLWSVTEAIERVLAVTQTFLSRCSFTLLVIKGTAAYVVQHGSTALVRYRHGDVESFANPGGDRVKKLETAAGDVFCVAPFALCDHLLSSGMIDCIKAMEEDLNHTAHGMVSSMGSRDPKLPSSVALIEVVDLPQALLQQAAQETLPILPTLCEGDKVDTYTVQSLISESLRSRVYRVTDGEQSLVMKCPIESDNGHMDRDGFLLQEWLLQRLDHTGLVQPAIQTSRRESMYLVTQYIEGRTLGQWLFDAKPSVPQIIDVIEQLGRVLLCMHRAGVYHRAIGMDNCVIDDKQHVCVVDISAAYIQGVGACGPVPRELLGAVSLAPELASGEPGCEASDQYMLAALAYTMLSGGEAPSRQRYQPLASYHASLHPGIDTCLKRALKADPFERFGDMGEFLHALTHLPATSTFSPMQQRIPTAFWQGLSVFLGMGWLLTVVVLSA